MARYVDDFMGIPNEFHRARGMDPNYHRHYEGMRTRGSRGQAPYGEYRARHQREMGGSAGYHGLTPWEYAAGYDRGYRGSRGYDREHRRGGGGGVHDPRYDREYLRDFNAYSAALRGGEGYPHRGYDERMWPREQRPGAPPPAEHEGYRQSYGNRGISSGGYGQPWLGTSKHPKR